ncbi:MAG: hypothetical protein WCY19_02995 [Candidatus Gastranaerophilaceae bacterium]
MENYFIGLMLSSGANTESGVAVLDKNNEIILLDKLFSMQDVQHFFENFSSLKDSQVCISLPWDNSMLNGKWRILSKPYQLVASNENFQNTDNWTQRFSNRGSEYFNSLAENGIKVCRFELYLTRQALKLNSCFKERSPADCKALQNALRIKYGFNSLPSNMMPMAHLEALVGAVLAKNISEGIKKDEKPLFEFNGIPVIRG